MNRRQLHSLFVQKFKRDDVTIFNLRSFLRRKGWQEGRVGRAIDYSNAEIAFLKQHQGMKLNQLHATFVEKFNRSDVECHNIRDMCCRRGLREKRYDRLARSPLGAESVSKNGFIVIKISHISGRFNYRGFVHKHRWLWEHKNGPIPDGHKLKCLDGNKFNTDPTNWECVPNGVLSRLHKRGYEQAAHELKPTIMAVAKLEHALKRGKRSARL